MVLAANRVTLAVADACPLSRDLSLPRHYMQTMMELQARGAKGGERHSACRLQSLILQPRADPAAAPQPAPGQKLSMSVRPLHCKTGLTLLTPCLPTHASCDQEELLEEPATSRRVPEWGQAIFSPLAVCMTPESPEGLTGFLNYCVALTRAHIMVGRRAKRRGAVHPGACALAQWLA